MKALLISFCLLAGWLDAGRNLPQNSYVETDVNGTKLPDEFMLLSSIGKVDNYLVVHKFGNNPSISTSYEDIWYTGGTYAGFITFTSQIRVKSGGNAADTAAGAGARTIKVEGLDANFAITSTTLTLAGANASAYGDPIFSTVVRAYVVDAGTYHSNNTGDVVIETSNGTVMASIPATYGQTLMSMYTVPTGYTAWLQQLNVNVSSANSATVRFWQSRDGDDVVAPFGAKRIVWTDVDIVGESQQTFPARVSFPEQTDLWFDAIKVTGGGNAAVSVTYDLLLIPN